MTTEREADQLKEQIRRLDPGDKEQLRAWLDGLIDQEDEGAIRSELERQHHEAERADRGRFASGRQDEMQQDA